MALAIDPSVSGSGFIGIDVRELHKLARRAGVASKRVTEEMKRAATESAFELQEAVVVRTPTHTGSTRQAIHVQPARAIGKDVIAVVRGTGAQFPALEGGRKPGSKMPPPDALIDWVRRRLDVEEDEARGVAWAVSVMIGRFGFLGAESDPPARKGRWLMFHDAGKAKRRRVKQIFRAALRRIGDLIAGGR